jgi:hypothetical protein
VTFHNLEKEKASRVREFIQSDLIVDVSLWLESTYFQPRSQKTSTDSVSTLPRLYRLTHLSIHVQFGYVERVFMVLSLHIHISTRNK